MPLYEYECDACHHRFEVIQKFSDAPLTECPQCGGHLQKLPSSPAIQFKGTGWYITDYARAGKSDEAKSATAKSDGKSESKSDDGKSESKSDSASETKTETKTEATKSETKSDSKPAPPTTS